MAINIVSAAEFEALPLLQRLTQRGIEAEYLSTGIGAINAAKSSHWVASKCKDNHVIFAGTCGSFIPVPNPILVKARRVIWLPPCIRARIAWKIEGVDPLIDLPVPPSWSSNLHDADVFCSSTISRIPDFVGDHEYKQPEVGNELAVENLELFSCAKEICQVAASFVAILGITNSISLTGRQQWHQNFQSLAEMTAQFIVEKLPFS